MTQQQIKIQLLKACKQHLASRREVIDKVLTNISLSLKEETKSSAGDKHETGRAMLQLDRENAGKQLAEIEKLEVVLNRIQTSISTGPIHLGSVVYSSQANYFIAIPAGKLEVNGEIFYAVGATSPMAKSLLGKEEDEHFEFREQNIIIQSIY